MHIKRITLSNFRSFRKQEQADCFSPHCNALIGRNGSGKSNLFAAVQFVLLAGGFSNLRQEERQAILHEGSGSAAVNAFVEVVFDNSDQRFSLDTQSDEVVLRRTIGLKKDEFFLQRKRANKQEVQSLLEGAGFSKSNPYFIVQQGKVQGLCTMSDAERLALLKEVAGTTVYDEKKAESLVKMEENAANIRQVDENLQDMANRLAELESEMEELSQYEKLDRERRCVEYTLYDKELQKARNVIDHIESERANHTETVSELHEACKESHENIRNVEGRLQAKTNVSQRNSRNLKQLEQEAKTALTLVTKLTLECRELQDAMAAADEQHKATQAELKDVNAEIAETQEKLDKDVQPAFDEAVTALDALKQERDDSSRQVDALYAKQNRGRKFKTVQERDAHLQSNIDELQAAQSEKQEALEQDRETLTNLRRTIAKEEKQVETLTNEITDKTNTLQTLAKSVEEKKEQRLSMVNARKECWAQCSDLQQKVKDTKRLLTQAQQDSKKVTPKATADGLRNLKTLVEREKLVVGEQYFGMVMDNFTLTDEKYQTAVDVAAQNSLFHVIVDSDHTAARLMRRLEERKLGRVTFLPLNQLRVERATYPNNTVEVHPMLEKCIEFDPKVEPAMKLIFGKKLIARSPEGASEWSLKCGMDAITLEGDLCSRKGAMTGGYVDSAKNRLRAHALQKEAAAELETMEAQYQEQNRAAQLVDQDATNVMQELQKFEAKHAELSHMVAAKEKSLERLQARIVKRKQQIETTEKESIPPLERDIATIGADVENLQKELGTPLNESLSEAEREQLDELKQTQTELGPKIQAQSEVVSKISLDRQKLLSLLNDNLKKRRRELTEGPAADEGDSTRRKSKDFATTQAQRKEDLAQLQKDLDAATRAKDDFDSRIAEARASEEKSRTELTELRAQLEKVRATDAENKKQLELAQDKSEKLLNKRTMCISKRDTNARKIQELGSLPPPSELKQFADKKIAHLIKALEKVNRKLKKYSHVNKKAFNQYLNFSEQRDALLKRKEELDTGAEKVKELVENLDRKKDEAINRTFRGVSRHFKDVFKELVPNGEGQLLMRTAAVDENQEMDEEAKKKAAENPDVSHYLGIGIKVRFAKVGENFMMSQLSGGQKALVAMALIFSIQRCDPAPFYLFDELDQALDSSYRAAVANVIHRQAHNNSGTQFIVSTFRPELVANSDAWFGVSLQNKVSDLHTMTKKDALHFIANLQTEEEQVGTAASASRKSRKSKGSSSRKRKAAAQEEEDDE